MAITCSICELLSSMMCIDAAPGAWRIVKVYRRNNNFAFALAFVGIDHGTVRRRRRVAEGSWRFRIEF